MHEVVVLLGAEIEFQAAYGRFQTESRRSSFESAFAEALANLSRFPQMGPIFHDPYHRLLLADFPQALYYTVEARRVFIHAIADTRQDLATLRRRLGIER